MLLVLHSEQDQYDGVKIAQPALDNTYVLIVDDYCNTPVQLGTQRAIKELGLEVVSSIEILTITGDVHPQLAHQHSDWHNGYYIAVINKG
jgi:hypothetical protein